MPAIRIPHSTLSFRAKSHSLGFVAPSPLNEVERSVSSFEGKRGYRCNYYIGIFHKLYRAFHAALPHAKLQGFTDDFHRKEGSILFTGQHFSSVGTSTLFELSYFEGHTYLVVGGRVILMIENGTVRYSTENNEVVEYRYLGGEVPTPVWEQFNAFLDNARKLEAVFKPVAKKVCNPPVYTLHSEHGEKPAFKPIYEYGGLIVTFKRSSRDSYGTVKEYRASYNNRRYERTSIPKAYQVEYKGETYWLPSSILPPHDNHLFRGTSKERLLAIPTWWLKKNNLPVNQAF